MRRFLILALTLLTSAPAFAQTPEPQEKSESLKIKDCELIAQGLVGLDGYQIVTNAGRPNEAVVSRPYEFANATLRNNILKNLSALKDVQTRANENRKATFNEYAKGQTEVPVAKRVEYSEKINEIGELPCDAQLKRVSIKSLLLGKNEIPGSVLQALEKILDE